MGEISSQGQQITLEVVRMHMQASNKAFIKALDEMRVELVVQA